MLWIKAAFVFIKLVIIVAILVSNGRYIVSGIIIILEFRKSSKEGENFGNENYYKILRYLESITQEKNFFSCGYAMFSAVV